MKSLNRCFLLLGGSGGIGQALIPQLLAKGSRVIIASRLAPATPDENPDILHVALDLGRADLAQQLRQLSDRYPQIDGVVHCAGQNEFGMTENLPIDRLDQMLSVNLRSAIIIARHFVARFREANQGTLLFVGSTFGSIGYAGFAAYCATKAGLRGFTEALRRELADTPIQIQYVAPRATRTSMNPASVNAMNEALGNRMDDPAEVAKQIIRSLEGGQARRYLGWPEKLFVVLNGLVPRLVDQSLRKQLPIIRRFLSGGRYS